MRLPIAPPLRLADSGGGGILCPSARRALLALALIAITLAAVASLRPHAAAHPGHVHPTEITVAMTRLAAETRTWYDDVLARTISEPLGTTRSNDLVISGTTTLRIGFGQGVLRPLTLANFTVTNGTLSNFRDLTPQPLGVTNNTTGVEIDVTPLADGPVTVGLPAGSLRGADGRPGGHDFSHLRNVEGSITLTARLGPPKVFWTEFVSNNAQGRGGGGPYPAGAHIDLAVFFSEQVTVSGSPTVRARTPGGTVDLVFHNNSVTLLSSANTLNGSGTSMLIFRHTVPAGGYSNGRTLIASDSIILPSGASIVDADGNAAGLALPPRFETLERIRPGPGTGLPTPGVDVGDTHTYAAVFNEPVAVVREPGAEPAWLPLDIQTNAGVTAEVRAVYVSGSGTRRLTFQYVVAAVDDVATLDGFDEDVPFIRVPQGFVIQNAVEIELSLPRYVQYQNVYVGYREGTRLPPLPFGYSRPRTDAHSLTLHLESTDPSRAAIQPSALLYRNSLLYPEDWTRRQVDILFLRDDDAEDNDVRLNYHVTSDLIPGRTLLTSHIVADGVLRITDTWTGGGPPCFLELELSLADDSDNVVQAGGSVRVAAKLVYIDTYRQLDITEPGTLSVAGGIDWETNGRRQIDILTQTIHNIGSAPPCAGMTIDGPTTWICELELEDSMLVVPVGTPDGVFTINGVVEVDGLAYRSSLDVTVGAVDEVASATLDFATDIAPGDSTDTPTNNWTGDDRPYPSELSIGESTTLQLAVLNENDTASAAGEIESILLTTTAGTLSLLNFDYATCVDEGDEYTCQVPVNLLDATNSDNILIELEHPGQAATATVRATVIAMDGEEFNPEPLTVTFLGPPETLAISAPDSPMLNIGTPDAGENRDDLDQLILSVTAADSAGNAVPVPADVRLAELRDSAGELVWSEAGGATQNGVRIDWPFYERGEDGVLLDADRTMRGIQPGLLRDPDGNLQVEIDIDAEAAAPLAAGEYTLELRAGGITAAQQIILSGAPAAVSLSKPQGDGITAQGGEITVTATVTDANGNPVTDGTPVTWAEPRITGETAVLVQIAIDTVTTDGTASASYLVVGSGASYLRASAGTGTDVLLFDAPPPTALPASPAEALTRRAPGGVSVWLGVGQTTASALLADIPHTRSIRTLRDGQWLRYSVTFDGRVTPGSVDFTVYPGDILWPNS